MPVADLYDCRLAMALCGRLRCNADWGRDRATSQRLLDHELWYVWAGRGTMHTHAGDFDLRPGFCVWMRPGGIYDATTDPRDRLGITYLHFDVLARRSGRWRKVDPRRSAGTEFHDAAYLGYIDALTQRIVQLVNADAPAAEASRRIAAELTLSLLRDLEHWTAQRQHPPTRSTDRRHRDMMMQIAADMRDRPADIPPVADLAGRAGYSASHFHDLFKSVLGQSPQEFAITTRIERARQLLVESDLAVGRIAEALGYRDVYFFSRQFKRRTGRSPSAFRRASGGSDR